MKRSDIFWGVFGGLVAAVTFLIVLIGSVFLLVNRLEKTPMPSLGQPLALSKSAGIGLDPAKRYDICVSNTDGAFQTFSGCLILGYAENSGFMASLSESNVVLEYPDKRQVFVHQYKILSIVESEVQTKKGGA